MCVCFLFTGALAQIVYQTPCQGNSYVVFGIFIETFNHVSRDFIRLLEV